MLVRKIYKGHPEKMGIYPDHIPQPDQMTHPDHIPQPAKMTHPDQISKLHDSLSFPSFELRKVWDHTIRNTKTLPKIKTGRFLRPCGARLFADAGAGRARDEGGKIVGGNQ